MTMEEVGNILGDADREKDCGDCGVNYTWTWVDGHQEIDVTFRPGWEGEPAVVIGKRFHPESVWDYLRDR
jgi:hypothetical protein